MMLLGFALRFLWRINLKSWHEDFLARLCLAVTPTEGRLGPQIFILRVVSLRANFIWWLFHLPGSLLNSAAVPLCSIFSLLQRRGVVTHLHRSLLYLGRAIIRRFFLYQVFVCRFGKPLLVLRARGVYSIHGLSTNFLFGGISRLPYSWGFYLKLRETLVFISNAPFKLGI